MPGPRNLSHPLTAVFKYVSPTLAGPFSLFVVFYFLRTLPADSFIEKAAPIAGGGLFFAGIVYGFRRLVLLKEVTATERGITCAGALDSIFIPYDRILEIDSEPSFTTIKIKEETAFGNSIYFMQKDEEAVRILYELRDAALAASARPLQPVDFPVR